MIAAWMVYDSRCALGLSLAAVLAERALVTSRRPVRVVWIGAMALSIALPGLAFRLAPRTTVMSSLITVAPDVPAIAVDSFATPAQNAPASVAVSPPRGSWMWSWRTAVARWDTALITAWITLSIALAVYFACGMLALALMRRRWRRRQLLGIDVLIWQRTGPELVGALSPAIVVPEWALALEAKQLALMLEHEENIVARGTVSC